MVISEHKIEIIQPLVLITIAVLHQIGAGIAFLDFVYHFRAVFNMSASLIGLTMGLVSFSYIMGCMFLSKLYTDIRPRNQLVMGCTLFALTLLLISRATNIYQLWFLMITYGLSQTMVWPTLVIWLTRGKEGIHLSKTLSAYSFFSSLGAGISPLICTLLVEKNTYLPLQVTCALAIIEVLIILIVSSLIPQIRATTSEKSYVKTVKGEDHSTPLRFYAWIGVFCIYFMRNALYTTFPLFTKETLHWNQSTTGLILVVLGLVGCVGYIFYGKFHFWHFSIKHIIIAQLCVVIPLIVFNGVSSVLLFALFFAIIGFVTAAISMESIFHGASGAVNRSKRMNINEIILNSGTFLGGIIGGSLFQHYGFSQMFLIIALNFSVILLVEIMLYYSKAERKHRYFALII